MQINASTAESVLITFKGISGLGMNVTGSFGENKETKAAVSISRNPEIKNTFLCLVVFIFNILIEIKLRSIQPFFGVVDHRISRWISKNLWWLSSVSVSGQRPPPQTRKN